MNISAKLDKLESITREQQVKGTQKLKKGGINYDDGTIQGVVEHIPAGSGTYASNLIYGAVPYTNKTISGGIDL